jgi:uncharacterized protein YidB (DUF937 family)
MSDAGVGEAARTLVSRVSLDYPWVVAYLLRELRQAGADDAVRALLARDSADRASLDYPRAIAELLRELRQAGADDAVRALLARDPADRASLDDTRAVAELLQALHEAGAGDAAHALATRAANAGMFGLFLETCPDKASDYLYGREPDGAPSQSWRWKEPGQLGPWSAEATLPPTDCRLPTAEFAS